MDELFQIAIKYPQITNMYRFILFISFLFVLKNQIMAQDSVKVSPIKWSGYVKFLETQNVDHLNQSLSATHLIHNRMRMKWNIAPKIQLQAELRNRIFWGSAVRNNPFFAEYLKNQNEWFGLSTAWINQLDLVAHSTFDRLYLDWKWKKISFRVGRQRINWGISSVWNPNDIFNAYNFLDVDYEERPGSDAIKMQYHFENMSSLEAVYAQTSKNTSISAIKYFFNRSNVDFQFIAGNYHGGGTFGLGIAGNLGDAGIKAELQHYLEQPSTSLSQTNLTLGIDYLFAKGWYVSGGYLLNSLGITTPIAGLNAVDFRLSSKNLMPTKHNYLLMLNKQLGPLSSVSLTSIYAPQTSLLIAIPTFSYSMSNNIEMNIFWQSFYAEVFNSFRPVNNVWMARLRWSF